MGLNEWEGPTRCDATEGTHIKAVCCQQQNRNFVVTKDLFKTLDTLHTVANICYLQHCNVWVRNYDQ